MTDPDPEALARVISSLYNDLRIMEQQRDAARDLNRANGKRHRAKIRQLTADLSDVTQQRDEALATLRHVRAELRRSAAAGAMA